MRIAGDGQHGPHVGAHRETEQIGGRPHAERGQRREQHRGQHQTDGVVHEEGRQQATANHDAEQEPPRRPGPLEDPLRRPFEEMPHLEVADDEHQAEEEDEHIKVDRRIGLLERQDAKDDHRDGAEQTGRRPVQVHERQPLDGDEQVGCGKDDQTRDHHRTSLSGANSVDPPQQPEQTVERRERVRWAPWDPQVHREDVTDAGADLRTTPEWAPADGAGPDCNDQLRGRDRFIRQLQRASHVPVYRPGDDDAVGVTRRSHELDAESGHVEHHVAEGDELGFAPVAAPRDNRAESEGAPEQASRALIQRAGELDLAGGGD